MSFLKEFTKWVKGWRLDKFLKGLVSGNETSAADLQATIETSNEFVERVKGWLKSPVGDIAVSVIPGDWDDGLRQKAINVLDKMAITGAIVGDCTSENGTVGEQLTCVYNKVLSVEDETKEKNFWHELAMTSAMIFTDGKITFSDLVIAVGFVYRLITKKK